MLVLYGFDNYYDIKTMIYKNDPSTRTTRLQKQSVQWIICKSNPFVVRREPCEPRTITDRKNIAYLWPLHGSCRHERVFAYSYAGLGHTCPADSAIALMPDVAKNREAATAGHHERITCSSLFWRHYICRVLVVLWSCDTVCHYLLPLHWNQMFLCNLSKGFR